MNWRRDMWNASDRFKESIRGYHAPVVRVRAMPTVQFGYPLETDGEVLDVISGNVKFVSTADIKSTLDTTLAGRHWDTVQPYGVELFAERGIDYNDGTFEMAPLGYFRVQNAKQDDAPGGPVVVAASDRGVRLKEHRVISPYNYPTGTTHRQIFNQLINGFSLSPSPFDVITYPMYAGKTVPITFFGYDPDSAKLPAGVVDDFVGEFLSKIADGRGCVVYFDRLGGVVVDQRDRAPGTDPVYIIEPGSNGNMIKYSRQRDRGATYNVVAARGSDPAYPTGLGLTYNNDVGSPLNYQGPFEAVVRKYASPLLHTTEQAGSASRKIVLRYKGLPSGASAVTLPDPTIDPYDVLLLRPPGLPEETAVSDTVTVPLDIVTPVTVGVRPQNEVSDEPDDTGGDEGDGTPGGAPIFPAAFRDARAYPAISATGASSVVNVSTAAALTSALAAAVAGQVITLADGSYSGTFTIAKKGTQAQPIVIKAANAGKAVLVSGSKVVANGAEWVLVTGLAAPYDQAGDTFVMQGACKFVRFTRNLIGPAVGPVTPDSWKLGLSSCINATTSAALARAASMGLDGWYNGGDTWYKDGNTPAFNADWDEKFQTTEYASLLASLKRKWHWVNVSDHEGYANDAPATAFGSAFQSAYRTQFAGKTLGPLPSVGIYCSGNIGRVGVILLDQRSFRSLDSATDNSSKTMLGATQKAWYKNLIASNAYPVWIVLGDVPIHTPTQAGDDSWAGFNTERNELKTTLDASTSKFVYLHGNMHALMRKANVFGYDLALGAAPLNNLTKVSAGGDNIDASFPANGPDEGKVAQQFGVLSVTDTGTAINFGFKGYDADGTERTVVATTLSVAAPGPAATSSATPAGNYIRVTDQAQDCVVDYNELRNKTRPGNTIAVDGDTAIAANAGGCQHILIAHNDIHDCGTEIDSGFEAIRFGSSDLSRTPSNSAVIRNVCTNILTGQEVISLRMAKVDVWGNSLNRSIGGIVYRYGTDGYVAHNYMLGPATGVGGTKAGGVRGYDANHEFSENYVYATNGDTFTGALVIDGGDSGTPALSGHFPLKGTKAKKNLLVACQTGILIGPNYTVPPDSIQVTDNLVVAPVGQTTALKTTKAPTGTNVLDPNLYAADATSAGVVADADGIYRKTGVGPRLTYLRRGDVGIAGDLTEADGSGKSIGGAPGGTPGGGGGTPTDPGAGTATSIANLLKLGKADGFSKVNIGIGFGPEANGGAHKDYDLAAIENGLSVPGYFELTEDKKRARFSAHLDGGRTSTNTKYPRTETRQLKADGVTKASFNPNEAKTRRVGAMARVTKMPPNKPQLCLTQSHDADDDTSMIYMSSKTTVQAKLGDTVVGTLTSSFAFNTDYYWMIEIIGDGSKCKLNYYWGTTPADMTTPKFTTSSATRSTTWYLKSGNYAQSNKDTDSVSDGPFIMEFTKLFMWETGMPAPLGWI